MANISKLKREKLLAFLKNLKENHSNNINSIMINEVENSLIEKKYGLVWEEHSENVLDMLENNIPIFKEVIDKKITKNDEEYNFLLEGDNLHSLNLLKKTHKGKIDLVYIDPPYNRGKDDFVYDDNYIDSEDLFKHSKWLSFMNHRLGLAKDILQDTGVIVIHIDENEIFNLIQLMDNIFGTNNNLGTIIWNKKNPKGDSKGVSIMHEYVLCYAKNKEKFLSLPNVLKRKKPNAVSMLKKAKSLFNKNGKTQIPEEIKEVIQPFNYPKEILKDFEVTYNLELINKEFQNWLKRQNFSGGEKAYKYIDENGEVYRGVSMAWPNKNQAPDDYFIPLVHPITNKPCPIPQRGWRNSSATMKNLLEKKLILFGDTEQKQPERKYLLSENLLENTPSIYESAASDDNLFYSLNLEFPYAKPVDVAKYFISSIHPDPKIIVDFFAGSGTTGHAVIQLNSEDDGNRKYILCTNNQNEICENLTYQRLSKIQIDLPHNLKYYKTHFIPKFNEDEEISIKNKILDNIKELIELEYMCEIDNINNIIIKTEEELEKVIDSVKVGARLFIFPFIFLSKSEQHIIETRDIKLITVPEYYFRKELKEIGEL